MNRQIILFDTEYTAWEGSKARGWSEAWEHREIIQIAAVRAEIGQNLTERGSFDCLIKPTHNSLLSPYITALTGIQQSAVDTRGTAFADAFAAFYTFCDQARTPLFCWGDDPGVIHENFTLNGLAPASFPAGSYDIRVLFEQAGIDTRQYTSGTVYQAIGVEYDCAAHNALNDVGSLVVTIQHLMHTGQIGPDWVEEMISEIKG